MKLNAAVHVLQHFYMYIQCKFFMHQMYVCMLKNLLIANLRTCLFTFMWTGLPMNKHQFRSEKNVNTGLSTSKWSPTYILKLPTTKYYINFIRTWSTRNTKVHVQKATCTEAILHVFVHVCMDLLIAVSLKI